MGVVKHHHFSGAVKIFLTDGLVFMDKKVWCKINIEKLTINGKKCVVSFIRRVADKLLIDCANGCLIDLNEMEPEHINTIEALIKNQLEKENSIVKS